MIKRNLITAIILSVSSVSYTAYVLLDTFVIPRVYKVVENTSFVNYRSDSEDKEQTSESTQKVYMNNFIFKEIIKNPEQIRYFLDNLFDSNAKGNPLIRDLEELLIHIGKENPERKKEEFEIKLEKVISYFKLIKFYEDRGGK